MTKLKILHIIPNLGIGGAEKFVIQLSNEQSASANVVICCLFDLTEAMYRTNEINPNIKIITLGKKNGFDKDIFFKIYQLIREERPQVIHTHLRALIYTILPALSLGIPTFHTTHNLAEREEENPKIRIIYKIVFNYFKFFPVAISPAVLNSIRNIYGKQFNTCIFNGIPPAEPTSKQNIVKAEIAAYKSNINTRVFIHVGRLGYQKNQEMLISVFQRLINENNNVLLLIIGEDTTSDQSTYLTISSRTNSRIYLLGVRNNISDYLLNADGFCLSSRYEGLPIALLEAFSCGLFAICTPVGGIPDVIKPGLTGILSEDVSEESYYSAIVHFLNLSNTDQKIIAENAKQQFKRFLTIENTAKQYLSYYRTILSK